MKFKFLNSLFLRSLLPYSSIELIKVKPLNPLYLRSLLSYSSIELMKVKPLNPLYLRSLLSCFSIELKEKQKLSDVGKFNCYQFLRIMEFWYKFLNSSIKQVGRAMPVYRVKTTTNTLLNSGVLEYECLTDGINHKTYRIR